MNIKELKDKMAHVPDHKMHHDTPMNQPMKKHDEPKKWEPSASMKALIEKRKKRFPHQYTPEAQKKNRASMLESFKNAKGVDSDFIKNHQKNTGRAYND